MKDLEKYSDLNATMTTIDHGNGFFERLPNNREIFVQLSEPKNKYEVSGADFSFSIETTDYVYNVERLIELMIDKLKSIKQG